MPYWSVVGRCWNDDGIDVVLLFSFSRRFFFVPLLSFFENGPVAVDLLNFLSKILIKGKHLAEWLEMKIWKKNHQIFAGFIGSLLKMICGRPLLERRRYWRCSFVFFLVFFIFNAEWPRPLTSCRRSSGRSCRWTASRRFRCAAAATPAASSTTPTRPVSGSFQFFVFKKEKRCRETWNACPRLHWFSYRYPKMAASIDSWSPNWR